MSVPTPKDFAAKNTIIHSPNGADFAKHFFKNPEFYHFFNTYEDFYCNISPNILVI